MGKLLNLAVFLTCIHVLEIHGDWFDDEDENQEEALQKFKTMAHEIVTEPFMKEEVYLLRWLRAHQFDIEKTFQALETAVEWRNTNNVSSLLQENFSSAYLQDYVFTLDGGVDKEERPILQIPFGNYNLRRITLAGQKAAFVRYIMYMFELTERYIHFKRTVEKHVSVTTAVAMADLQGFNLVTAGCWNCLTLVPDLVPIIENYYPGIFHRIYFINTPKMFDTMFALMKTLMSELTKDSIRLYDTDRHKYTAALLEDISSDQLPTQFGGLKSVKSKGSVKLQILEFYNQKENDVSVKHEELPAKIEALETQQSSKHFDHVESEQPESTPRVSHQSNHADEVQTTEAHVPKKIPEYGSKSVENETLGNHQPHHHYTTTSPNQMQIDETDSVKGAVEVHVPNKIGFNKKKISASTPDSRNEWRQWRVEAAGTLPKSSNANMRLPNLTSTALICIGAIVSRLMR